MKELNIHQQDKIKLHAEKQMEKKVIYVESKKLLSNHRCFEINNGTLEVKEAEYKRMVIYSNHIFCWSFNSIH